MDFLKIRKKAKERASAASKEGARGAAPAGEEPPPREVQPDALLAGLQPPADPVITGDDVLQGQLAATLQGLPAAEEARFTMWRPGSGATPAFGLEPSRLRQEPLAESLALVAGPVAAARAGSEPPVVAKWREPLDPLDEFFYRPDEEAPDVPQLGAAAPSPEEEGDGVAREEYLTFLLGTEEYAVAIGCVREVMKSPPITEVPRAPAHVLGVVTVRGEVVPVFDPRLRLGLAGVPAGERSRVVIVDAGGGPCGLLVDRIASVVRLRPGSIEQPPQGLSAVSADTLAGIGRDGDRMFMVLDLGALLRRGSDRRRARDGGVDAGA